MREKWIPLLLLALGGLAVGMGITRGELGVYFIKSINICLECVGIG